MNDVPSTTAPTVSKKIEYATYAICFLMIALFVGGEIHHSLAVRPPEKVTDFKSYLEWASEPKELNLLDENGTKILVATGRIANYCALPSGPPQYVFDTQGKMIDWISDSGEGKNWVPDNRYKLIQRMRSAEALDWIKANTVKNTN